MSVISHCSFAFFVFLFLIWNIAVSCSMLWFKASVVEICYIFNSFLAFPCENALIGMSMEDGYKMMMPFPTSVVVDDCRSPITGVYLWCYEFFYSWSYEFIYFVHIFFLLQNHCHATMVLFLLICWVFELTISGPSMVLMLLFGTTLNLFCYLFACLFEFLF